ncbi:MAG: hypothetical protein K9G60_15755 [Pseudolabrys sp.]|nr:hypothetical protein [Pseudolabrys sp.]
MADHIRYDLLTQQALRGVVRNVLTDAAKKGLPGDHHFYISFDTQADGVKLSDRLRAQYPEEMTIILQHQFWDLAVTEQGFEVGMSFGGIPEKLYVPFAAIGGFFDPSVQFGLQFEEVAEGQETPKPSGKKGQLTSVGAPEKPVQSTRAVPQKDTPLPVAAPPPALPLAAAGAGEPTAPKADKPSGGGEVVRLDRFRKK